MLKDTDTELKTGKSLLQKTPAVLVLATLCTMLWGSAFPLLKISFVNMGISDMGEIYDFIAYRFIIAGVLIAFLIKARGGKISLSGMRNYLIVALIAVVQVCLQFVFFYIGLKNTTGVKASIINGSGTFFIMIFSHIFISSDNVTLRKWIGAFIGFTGLVAVNFDPALLDLSFSPSGDGMILLTSITGAAGSLLVKKNSVSISPLHISMYQFIIGSVFLLAVSHTWGTSHVILSEMNGIDIGFLIYLGISSAVAFSLWYILIQYNNLSRIAVYFFMVPIWGALFSAMLIKNESLTPMTVIGAVLVSSGIYCAVKEDNQNPDQ